MSPEGNGAPRLALTIKLRELALQGIELGHIHGSNVRVVGMIVEVVLMVAFGVVEGRSGDEFGDDRLLVELCFVELGDIGGCDFLLIVVCVEDGGAILSADVRALSILLCGVVDDAKENHEELSVSDFGRIVNDTDAFRVSRGASADEFVVGIGDMTAAVAGSDFFDADHVLIDSLNSPETPT